MSGVDTRLERDLLGRVTRAREYVEDGEIGEALLVLDDLAEDLWRLLHSTLEEAA